MASAVDQDGDKETANKTMRTHFKIGSRKSKLAMVQSEYIMGKLKTLYPEYSFEIINFDTKGDQILSVALPKIGDKGLFTRELEDGLENGSIDFVVHSLKDMPCQTLPDGLIIAGVPEREDPSDALVIAERWRAEKRTLDDLGPGMCVGTSSLRRISQLKMKYPELKFETIRGNLQTRFAKLDPPEDRPEEKKFDAIILATSGLKRMGYENRISQILEPNICMHAVSQGALGVECRRNDSTVISMLNRLNHEDTVLKCIAERTFMAKLEGGCSAPIAVESHVTPHSIWLEGAVFDIDGSRKIQDRFEIKFGDKESTCPVVNLSQHHQQSSHQTSTSAIEKEPTNSSSSSSKRKLEEDEDDQTEKDNDKIGTPKKTRVNEKKIEIEPSGDHHNHQNKDYSFIIDLNIKENRLIKAELCGLHLAQKLKEKGADVLITEIKAQIHKTTF